MDLKSRVFCSSYNRHLIEDLTGKLPEHIKLVNNPGALSTLGDIGAFKRHSESFIFIPEPLPQTEIYLHVPNKQELLDDFLREQLLSLFLLNSLFVAIQIGDPNMAYRREENGQALQKHLIVYDPCNLLQDPNNPYSLLLEMLDRMEKGGRMQQKVSDLISIATTRDELIAHHERRTNARDNISHHEFASDEQEWKQAKEDILRDGFKLKPGYDLKSLTELKIGIQRGVAGFTSARQVDLVSQRETYLLMKSYGERFYTAISGVGTTGGMGHFNNAALAHAMHSIGWITAEVLDLECPPRDADYIELSPNIYSRMFNISLHSRESVIGVGGMGGGGTAQEALGELVLQAHGSNAVRFRNRAGDSVLKPTFVDDRLGLLGPLVKIADMLGLNKERHMHRCLGSADIETASRQCEADANRLFTRTYSFGGGRG